MTSRSLADQLADIAHRLETLDRKLGAELTWLRRGAGQKLHSPAQAETGAATTDHKP